MVSYIYVAYQVIAFIGVFLSDECNLNVYILNVFMWSSVVISY